MMAVIMVVDDTPASREPIARLLRLEGYQTQCANNGSEALEMLAEAPEQPDLILLDIMMPVMDGLTMLEELRNDPLRKDIPVIMLTALSDRQTIQRAQRLGVEGFLVKAQFSVGEMLERIRQAVN